MKSYKTGIDIYRSPEKLGRSGFFDLFSNFDSLFTNVFDNSIFETSCCNLINGVSRYNKEGFSYIELPLPGLDPESIDLTIGDGYLLLNCDKVSRGHKSSVKYTITVPDTDVLPTAEYKNGILYIKYELPKPDDTTTDRKKIEVKF